MATATKTYTFVDTGTIEAAEHNKNFDDVIDFLNDSTVHTDGSKAFTGIPSGPASDPTTDNQFARKAYVDAAASVSHTHNASDIDAGVLASARLPALTAADIVSGTFADARIPNINASKTTAGIFAAARIPDDFGGATKTIQKLIIDDEINVFSGSAGDPPYAFTSEANSGLFLASAGDVRVTVAGSSKLRCRAGDIGPTSNNAQSAGTAAARYSTVYSVNADDISSDMRLKTRCSEGLGLAFLERLTPFTGRWTYDEDKSCHEWLSAQDVASGLIAVGRDPEETALWGKATEDDNGNPVVDGEESLAYTELIPVLITAVQELAAMVREGR